MACFALPCLALPFKRLLFYFLKTSSRQVPFGIGVLTNSCIYHFIVLTFVLYEHQNSKVVVFIVKKKRVV